MKKQLPNSELILACRSLYSAIESFDHWVASSAGISRNDLRALNLLEGGPVNAGQIAQRLDMTTGAVTPLIDRLETKGLVKRVANPNDRRAVMVEATPRLFREIGSIYVGLAHRLEASAAELSKKDLSQLLASLRLVTGEYEAAVEEQAD